MNCDKCPGKIHEPVKICCQLNRHPLCAMFENECGQCKQRYSSEIQKSIDSYAFAMYNNYKESMNQRKAKQKIARESIRLSTAKIINQIQLEYTPPAKNDAIRIPKCLFK